MESTSIGAELQPSRLAYPSCSDAYISLLIPASAIKKEEKDYIKSRALHAGVVEPAPLLALHNALMIAKVMRYEFPQDWYATLLDEH